MFKIISKVIKIIKDCFFEEIDEDEEAISDTEGAEEQSAIENQFQSKAETSPPSFEPDVKQEQKKPKFEFKSRPKIKRSPRKKPINHQDMRVAKIEINLKEPILAEANAPEKETKSTIFPLEIKAKNPENPPLESPQKIELFVPDRPPLLFNFKSPPISHQESEKNKPLPEEPYKVVRGMESTAPDPTVKFMIFESIQYGPRPSKK